MNWKKSSLHRQMQKVSWKTIKSLVLLKFCSLTRKAFFFLSGHSLHTSVRHHQDEFYLNSLLPFCSVVEICRPAGTFSNQVGILHDQNQVSVSGTKTKVRFRYRYRSPFFFLKPKLLVSNFTHFSHFFLVNELLKAWI